MTAKTRDRLAHRARKLRRAGESFRIPFIGNGDLKFAGNIKPNAVVLSRRLTLDQKSTPSRPVIANLREFAKAWSLVAGFSAR